MAVKTITSRYYSCYLPLLSLLLAEILCLISVTTSVNGIGSSVCSSGEFQCANGHCILRDWKCDNDPDCEDESDEDLALCSNVTCLPDYFQCGGHVCIPDTWQCDGHADCANGIDEIGCEVRPCTTEEFHCSLSDQCISKRWICDQDDDCDDNSDEKNCEQQVCSNSTQFTCQNNRCIPLSWRCDGDNDCIDYSDETNCDMAGPGSPPPAVCHGKSMEFMCTQSHECIHLAWKCDGERDCVDGTDELTSLCGTRTCLADQFQCDDGSCIRHDLKCDGVSHCSDDSDESDFLCITASQCNPRTHFDCTGRGGHCIELRNVCNGHNDCGSYEDENATMCNRSRGNPCALDNGGCSHYCERTRVSYYCSCRPGYALGSDDHTCHDVDECLIPGTCSHVCLNTVGSYKCHCHAGYWLNVADHKCYAEGHEPMLLYANRHDIRMIGLHSRHHESIVDDLHSAVAVDYDFADGKIYWSDVASEKLMWATLNSSASATARTLVDDDISTPDGIALDWIHKNLYWADTGKNRIEVVSLRNTQWRLTLIKEYLDEPRAIVVDPRDDQRFLYWSDWGDVAKIERAVLDGTGRTSIITTGLQWPNGLTIDYESNKLFWIDAKLHLIGSSALDGSNQQTVLLNAVYIKHPFAITVFEDSLYWSDWESESIKQVSKYHVNGPVTANVTNAIMRVVSPMDVHVYHSLRQPAAVDLCATAGCNQLCLAGRTQPKCLCSDHLHVTYVLGNDGKTCISGIHKNHTTPTTAATNGTDGVSMDPGREKSFILHRAIVALATLCSIVFVVAILIVVVYHWCRHRRVKTLNFDNPVYRRTTTDELAITRRATQPKIISSVNEPLTSAVDLDA